MIQLSSIRNPELGYYQVGNEIYYSKIAALVDGTRRNIHPEWKFNNHIFDHFNWAVEPVESLDQLYLQRCRQIREKYDYLILLYSAGADSDTILQTCLKNNIRVDEILVSWPKKFSKLYTPDNTNFDPLNMLSEWDYAISPKLKKLAQSHPEIKITIHDWSEGIFDYKVEDGYVMERNNLLSPYCIYRNNFAEIPSVQEALLKKNRVGMVLGVDKPRICFHDNAYRLYFLDLITHGFGPQADGGLRKKHLDIEFFYWSPDSCQLLAKQAHLLVKFFEMFPGFKQYIQWPVTNPNYRTWYESSIKAVIYPEYDFNTFQANKFTEMTVGHDRLLFALGMGDRVQSIIDENMDYLKTVIDPKYFNQVAGQTTMTGFITGMWPIKTVV